MNRNSGRRSFLRAVSGVAVVCTAGVLRRAEDPQNSNARWSSGSEAPHNKAPANATDCHHHIYDSRFPIDPKATLRPGDATVADYRLLQKRLGIRRNVVVQPSTYGVDNSCLLDALRQFGPTATRGVAVVNTTVSDATLQDLHAAGVRGIRFNLVQAGATTLEMVEPLAKRVAPLGWHLQINAYPEQIMAGMGIWNRLPSPVVFDHLGHVPSPGERVFGAIASLLQKGRCWVKLSGAYMDSKEGAPSYSDSAAVAKAYIKAAPQRLVWGTDWPHPTTRDKPDDALLFDLLREWCPNEAVWTGILVDNPAMLYGFR
jgi:D-galactarolactone isomerase